MADQATSIFIGAGPGGAHPQSLQLSRANRHGLIAGATGTGKTVTLQGIVEQQMRFVEEEAELGLVGVADLGKLFEQL